MISMMVIFFAAAGRTAADGWYSTNLFIHIIVVVVDDNYSLVRVRMAFFQPLYCFLDNWQPQFHGFGIVCLQIPRPSIFCALDFQAIEHAGKLVGRKYICISCEFIVFLVIMRSSISFERVQHSIDEKHVASLSSLGEWEGGRHVFGHPSLHGSKWPELRCMPRHRLRAIRTRIG